MMTARNDRIILSVINRNTLSYGSGFLLTWWSRYTPATGIGAIRAIVHLLTLMHLLNLLLLFFLL